MNIPSRVNPFGYDNTTPPGYVRAEFLESTGSQYIYLEGELTSKVACSFTVTPTKIYENNYFGGRNENYYVYAKIVNSQVAVGQIPFSTVAGFEASTQEIYNVELDRQKQLFTIRCGEEEKKYSNAYVASTPKALIFFGGQGANNNPYFSHARMSDISVSHDGVPTHTFITSLDPTGTPCLYDLVTKKPFYNAATTGSGFIVGLTMKQAISLANLPATGGSLTISIPLEAAFDANVQSALNTAADKGWTITVQYRESELTTKNIDADFLESTGGQYIALPYSPLSPANKVLDVGVRCETQVVETTNWKVPLGCARSDGKLGIFPYGNSGVNRVYFMHGVQRFDYTNASLRNLRAKSSLNWLNSGTYHVETEQRTFEGELEKEQSSLSWGVKFTLFSVSAGTYEQYCASRIWSAAISHNKEVLFNLIPALDSTGVPCMHDTVGGQNFYNSNTAEGATPFTVGFDTTEKAAISISKLPVKAGGTLTVSLPAAAQDTDTLVSAAIDIATNRGWTIITQYRED